MGNLFKAFSLLMVSFFVNPICCIEKSEMAVAVEKSYLPKEVSGLVNIFHLTSHDADNITSLITGITDECLSEFLAACHNLAAKTVAPADRNELDAVIVDAAHHEVIAENDYVRVLWGTLKAGERDAAHTHQWPCVMLVMTRSVFLAHDVNGGVEQEICEPGVYELEGDDEPCAYTNCGNSDFHALVIELKKTLPEK